MSLALDLHFHRRMTFFPMLMVHTSCLACTIGILTFFTKKTTAKTLRFWTGYFTSRPALKRYIRDTSAFFQAETGDFFWLPETQTNSKSTWKIGRDPKKGNDRLPMSSIVKVLQYVGFRDFYRKSVFFGSFLWKNRWPSKSPPLVLQANLVAWRSWPRWWQKSCRGDGWLVGWLVGKSPKDRVIPLPNGRFMAYKWEWS